MVIFKTEKNQCYIDGYLKEQLEIPKEAVLKKEDMFVCIIDGKPGTGKSTLVDQLAHFLSDGNHSLKDKAWLLNDYSKMLDKSYKGQNNNCKVLDEGYEFNKKKTNSYANFKLLGQMQRIRAKRQFIFITLPFMWDLDRNIILGLCNLFIHCYRESEYGPKGRFGAYSASRLKTLWNHEQSKKNLAYYIKPNFYGRFTKKWLSGDFEEYEKLKNQAFSKLEEQEVQHKKEWRNQCIAKVKDKFDITQKELAELFEMDRSSISRILSKPVS